MKSLPSLCHCSTLLTVTGASKKAMLTAEYSICCNGLSPAPTAKSRLMIEKWKYSTFILQHQLRLEIFQDHLVAQLFDYMTLIMEWLCSEVFCVQSKALALTAWNTIFHPNTSLYVYLTPYQNHNRWWRATLVLCQTLCIISDNHSGTPHILTQVETKSDWGKNLRLELCPSLSNPAKMRYSAVRL